MIFRLVDSQVPDQVALRLQIKYSVWLRNTYLTVYLLLHNIRVHLVWGNLLSELS